MNFQEIIDKAPDYLIPFALKLVGAIAIWIIGIRVIKFLSGRIKKILDKRETEEALKSFLDSLLNIVLKVILIVSILGILGVKMALFITIIGAAGLAIGMALSGTLQNFAGSMVILMFKPFKVGDLIEAQGHKGFVKEIQIFNTILKTPDNKTVVIPNGGLSNSSMTNYSTEPKRRVDWVFGIAYGDDTYLAEKIIKQICAEDSRIFKDPEPFVVISELADSSVNLTVRTWVKTEDYWGVYFDMNKKVYKTFEQQGINIPFPQMDVHLQKNE
ncbi:MAG: mechanosensitive ion channel protein MscS [Draconibacterium sp.]|nr:MAG: mechanosensitive ion channel protein MscS [Draconibacterium sp.]